MSNSEVKITSADCARVRELIYESLPGSVEEEALLAHTAGCPGCNRELAEWKAVRQALRSPGLKMTAPPDFKMRVMSRIAAQSTEGRARGTWSSLLKNTWAKGVAAAAVLLTLLTGSLVYAGRYLGVSQIATNQDTGHHAVVPRHTASTAKPDQKTPQSQVTSATKPGQTPTATTAVPSAKGSSQPAGTASGSSQIAASSRVEELPGQVLLNKTRYINTSLLRIRVADLDQSQNQALALAREYGAELSTSYSTQNNGHLDRILRFTAAPAAASRLQQELAGLGSVIVEDTTSENITSSFNRTLNDYQNLKAQQAAAPEEKKGELAAQLSFLEQQLINWEKESSQQVIILLLEE